MSHDHDHGGHSHAPANFGTAFVVGIALNSGFVLVEAVYGYFAHSLALMADAGHNLSDVLGLLLAWGATVLARRAPSTRHTYGLRSSSILASLFNAVFLLVAIGAIAWEAIGRFSHSEPVQGKTVIVVALIGIAINTITALMFMAGRKNDLNIRGAFLHMVADAGVSAGVVVAGIVMLFTGWLWLDPVVSLTIAVVILVSTWGLLKDSVNLSLHAVPEGIQASEVKAYLADLPDVRDVHDLHIWAMSTTENRTYRSSGANDADNRTTRCCPAPRRNCTTVSASSISRCNSRRAMRRLPVRKNRTRRSDPERGNFAPFL